MNPRPMRAGIYTRASTNRQEDSPGVQLSQTRPHCAQRGYVVAVEYLDFARKGDDDSRPDFLRLLADAQAGKIDVIVCDRQDRLSRQEPEDFIADVIRPLKRAGVFLDTVKEGQQRWETIGGLIVGTVQAHAASEEPKKTSGRVLGKIRSLVAQGRPAGGTVSFGYKYEHEEVVRGGKTRRVPVRLVPDWEGGEHSPARIVQQLFDLYANGNYSLLDLCNFLEERGVASPRGRKKGRRRWWPCSVSWLLRNDVYTGRLATGRTSSAKWSAVKEGVVVPKENGGIAGKKTKKGKPRRSMPITANPEEEWVVSPQPHEALVSQELFDQVQAKLTRKQKGRGRGVRRREKVDDGQVSRRGGYLFSGLLVCEHCQRTLTGHPGKPGQDGPVTYRCPIIVAGGHGPCRGARVQEAPILERVIKALEDTFLNPEHLARLEAQLLQEEESARQPGNVNRLRQEVGDLEAQITRAKGNLVLLEPDEIAPARERIKELQARRDTLADELAQANSTGSEIGELRERVAEMQGYLWNLKEAVRLADPVLLRGVIESMVGAITIRWDVRPAANGNQNFHWRVPVGGTIYLGDSWTERFSVQSGEPDQTPNSLIIPFTLTAA